jgi:hypothetical protein
MKFDQNTPIATICRNSDQMDLFAVGLDGRVYSAWWNGNPWRDWFPIGDRVFAQNTPIATICRNSDQMDLFAVGLDGRVYSAWWNGQWKPWFTIGSRMFAQKTPIATICRNSNQMDLFAVHVTVGRVYSASWNGQWRGWFLVGGKEGSDYFLDPPALEGTPAHAFASHKTRASAIARQYAMDNPLTFIDGTEVDEDNTIQLIAHLQALDDDPNFVDPSGQTAQQMLRKLKRGEGQLVGTSFEGLPGVAERKGDYDFALKGLIVILYRYRHLLSDDDCERILVGLGPQVPALVPPDLVGPYDPSFEKHTVKAAVLGATLGGAIGATLGHFFLGGIMLPIIGAVAGAIAGDTAVDYPETENHLLMINSTKYLLNQILFYDFDETRGDPKYNNNDSENGMTKWLLGYMQTIAKHDFLEFNSRPYQRLSLHALLNLHEFARDKSIRDAAQILLDYAMVKFAVSSNRQRRICPFRRLKEHTNRPDNQHNELLGPQGEGKDAVIGFFLMYAGPTDANGNPTNRLPAGWAFEALIAGLATYRPPLAAYILGMKRDIPAFQHRFYHGKRPPIEAEGQAEGGVEIYYSSPSFLLTAGGMYLNSGYAGEIAEKIVGYKQAAIAQSTTLLPTRADVKFVDLIRFDPYPDEPRAVNTGVHQGFACGINLRVPDRWLVLSGTSWEGNWLFLNLNREMPGTKPLGFYVVVYRTPVASAEIDPAPESLGLLYAMEASQEGVLSFEEFKNLTLARNTALPLTLNIAGTYDFHSAENKHFRFFYRQINTSKYAPQVFLLSEENPITDFTSLPLIEGPYLKAPSDHDGYIEIRYPGCETTPLVLDFSNPENPDRRDNIRDCPDPWLDRAQALLDFAQKLSEAGKHKEEIAALRDRVKIYQMLAEIDPIEYGPDLASALDLLAENLWYLIPRLIEAERINEVLAPAQECIQIYRQAAAAGAEVTGISNNLRTLSLWLATDGFTTEADAAADAAANILP